MPDITQAIESVWKAESTRLIAGIARVTRDIGTAEELAQDAFLTALERWPLEGIPDNPAAWLMTAAKRRAIDNFRRNRMSDLKHAEIIRELEHQQQQLGQAMDAALDQVIDDDILRLIFTACHPLLPVEARVALTLRLIGGLTTTEIARAFLLPEKTIGQRIFRAKKTLTEANIPFELPRTDELRPRLDAVLSVLYLIFNEGYTATSGDDWLREDLCNEALRLTRILAQLLPNESEVHALLALMELQASRTAARRDPTGAAILLPAQDRTLWDHAQIQRGLAALHHAHQLNGAAGNYALQAAIAAVHAQARTSADTDWPRIVDLYDQLLTLRPNPIVALNRAVALSMSEGPAAALQALDALAPNLPNHHLVPTVRADLLQKLNRPTEAREELQRALTLTTNTREQDLLTSRLAHISLNDQPS
jgi:RNA polymerase sigma-70 factor (ECF subfamily)